MSSFRDRDLQFIPGSGEKLTFDAGSGFAINPQITSSSNNAICFSGEHRNQLLTIVGTGTITIYGSGQKTPPDFTQPSTIDNSYDTVMSADYQAVGTYYTGAAGIPVSNATKLVEINTNLLPWIAIHRSANTVDVKLVQSDNG